MIIIPLLLDGFAMTATDLHNVLYFCYSVFLVFVSERTTLLIIYDLVMLRFLCLCLSCLPRYERFILSNDLHMGGVFFFFL
jgi:hypothetical protein